MRRVGLLILLAVASSHARAEWVKVTSSTVGVSGTLIAYADPDVVPKYSERVKMREMHDFRRSNLSNTSSKKRVEYDCNKKEFRQLNATYYSEGMGKGSVVMNVSDPGQWEKILPDTVTEKMWKFACKNQ